MRAKPRNISRNISAEIALSNINDSNSSNIKLLLSLKQSSITASKHNSNINGNNSNSVETQQQHQRKDERVSFCINPISLFWQLLMLKSVLYIGKNLHICLCLYTFGAYDYSPVQMFPERQFLNEVKTLFIQWPTDNLFKKSDKSKVTWQVLTNQSALFQSRVVTKCWNYVMRSAPTQLGQMPHPDLRN